MAEPSTQSGGVIHTIRWNEICPWLILVRALRVTLFLRVLLLATVGVYCTQLGWETLDQIFSLNLAETNVLARETVPPPTLSTHTLSEQAYPLVKGWEWASKPFLYLLSSGKLALMLYGLWAVVVWSLFGGVIARIAALYLTRGKTLGPVAALRDAIGTWRSTMGAALISFGIAVALAAPLVLLGLLLKIKLAAMLAGLLWCFVLAWSLVFALFLLGIALGWPLILACLSVEQSDAFDGISRCFAYVYQRPLHLLFFLFVAAMLCTLGGTFVSFLVTSTIGLSESTLAWGLGNHETTKLLNTFPAIHIWKYHFSSIHTAYPLACLWPMAVGMYLLLRRLIDATEMDEVTLLANKTE